MGFWDVLKEVTAERVRREYETLFRVGVAGESNDVQAVVDALVGDVTGEAREDALRFVYAVPTPLSDADRDGLARCDEVIALPGGPGLTELRPAHVASVAAPEEAIAGLLALRPERHVAYARRLPGCRAAAADLLIQEVSKVNAQFTAASNIAVAAPLVAWLIPASASADTLVLTKNQVLMIFRLAAMYDYEPLLRSRWRETTPVIGAALGWRAIARGLAGLVPGPVGFATKVSMAYAGTYVDGKSAQYYYEHGSGPSRDDLRRWGLEAKDRARELIEKMPRPRWRSTTPMPEPAALPNGHTP